MSQQGARLQTCLAAVRRMALSNYIAQSVICTFVFWSWTGLVWVKRVGQFAVVVYIWALLIVFSQLWLQYFRFGPLQWLWSVLVYLRCQPMRK